jgi:hypothetical protein
MCLVSEHWLASDECFSEFRAAWFMGKRIVPLLLLTPQATLFDPLRLRFAEVYGEVQGIDITKCLKPNRSLDFESNHDIARLLTNGLRNAGVGKVGLDPEAFDINCARRSIPFPGLDAFDDDDADAALFYGRGSEIADTLEELRKMRAEADRRSFAILGASGTGKSSLLRAGIIPRLRREMPSWLPLRAFRPGADPILNFAEAISRTLADFDQTEASGTIRQRILQAWSTAERNKIGDDNRLTDAGITKLSGVLDYEGDKVRAAANLPSATILISIDQAEELVSSDGRSYDALADYLSATAVTKGSWHVAFTIRTVSFNRMQKHPRLRNLTVRGYDLRAIPVSRLSMVIEEPAKRYGILMDNSLTDALVNACAEGEVLPLLAFTLQRLWRQFVAADGLTFPASGRVTKAQYDQVLIGP